MKYYSWFPQRRRLVGVERVQNMKLRFDRVTFGYFGAQGTSKHFIQPHGSYTLRLPLLCSSDK
jgi:hypothetical protein